MKWKLHQEMLSEEELQNNTHRLIFILWKKKKEHRHKHTISKSMYVYIYIEYIHTCMNPHTCEFKEKDLEGYMPNL